MFARSAGVLSGNRYTVVEFSSCSCEGTSADLGFLFQIRRDGSHPLKIMKITCFHSKRVLRFLER